MASLAWLLIPLMAAICAGLWGSWAGRNRKTAGDGVELEGYARFRAAMERSGAVTTRSDTLEKSPSDAV
ncbi:hypothetical protein ACWD7F_02315 [Streptomyces sp. NPDC005122]